MIRRPPRSTRPATPVPDTTLFRSEVRAVAFAQRLEAAQVADRRVQPDVQELARVAGDLEAEVGRVARDVPGAQAAFAVQPLLQLGLDPGHGDVAGQPVADRKSTRMNSSH